MRRNGFTLVEVVTVIVILITISIIAVFSITGIVRSSTEKLYQLQVENIIDASRTYAVKNSNTLSDNNEITLCDLKRSSLLEEDLKNPKTEKPFDDSLIIRIVKDSNGEFQFSFDGVSVMENYECDLNISVTMNGDSPYYAKLGDNYDDLGVTVRRGTQNCTRVFDNTHSTSENCYYSLTISGDYGTALSDGVFVKTGTYKETYTVKDENFSSTVTRTFVIQDKTPPTIRVSYNGVTHTNSFSERVVEGSVASFTCSATDNNDQNVQCTIQKNDYNGNTNPGTYEIIYSAKDKYGNSSTLVVNVTVISKNKKLVAGVSVDKVEWTNENVTLTVFPLYSSQNCTYAYTHDGFFWDFPSSQTVEQNGNYKMGIKCAGTDVEDIMYYKVTNIDKTAPTFENGASMSVTSENSNFSRVTISGLPHYYSSDQVTINYPSGATDEGSGVAGYEVYVNGTKFEGTTLSGNGKYEIKLLAYDYAGNRSELETLGYVVISNLRPTCEFLRCNNIPECNSTNPIVGDNLEYAITKGGYMFTINNYLTYIPIQFKFSCTYQYYDGEEAIYATTNIRNISLTYRQQNGVTPLYEVIGVTNDSSESTTTCSDGLCTKTNYYTASVNCSEIFGAANLSLSSTALCDRVGNCNRPNNSMDLWPKQ